MNNYSLITSDLDPFSPEFRADPFTAYAQLRELPAPLVWLPQYSICTVSRYEPVRAVLGDWKRFRTGSASAMPAAVA
jgi:hypothetical protein